jgi:hypothetical protein
MEPLRGDIENEIIAHSAIPQFLILNSFQRASTANFCLTASRCVCYDK